jgi:two-component system phosphate regulon response regulator PhoB
MKVGSQPGSIDVAAGSRPLGTSLRRSRPPRPPGVIGPHVLVVDDDEIVRMLLLRYLAVDGFSVEEAADATAAVAAVRRRRPDLVVVDVMMPGRDGLDLLAELRAMDDELAIIMLTAKGDEADRVIGLRLGADDYVVKPFSPVELVARIAAVLRRPGRLSRPSILEFGDLSLNLTSRNVILNGEVVPTTTKEFALLSFLASSPTQVFTREQLLDKVWGSSSNWQDPGTVTEHVRRVRLLIEEDPTHPLWIRTVRGTGYSFEPRRSE